MSQIDGFQTTDSFRFDRGFHDLSSICLSSSSSSSSSSGYGSRLSLSQTHLASSVHPSSTRRTALAQYFKEKLSRHKSIASLFLSPTTQTLTTNDHDNSTEEVYESVWNLDEQIAKLRSTIDDQQRHSDVESIISMSVDEPYNRTDDRELLSAAAWYQEGLPRHICEEYLSRTDRPIGSFIIRRSFTQPNQPFVLSIRTDKSNLLLVEHFLIERTPDDDGYRIQGSMKTFDNLSTLVVHHTVMSELLPVTLVLTSFGDNTTRQQSTSDIIRSVRF